MPAIKRTAFFVSDSTGITAEVVGDSLLIHFPDIEFERQVIPYVDDQAKAADLVNQINAAGTSDGAPPVVFLSIMNTDISKTIQLADCFFVDVLNAFMKPLEVALGCKGNHQIGRSQKATSDVEYSKRIEAVHFALENDDGGMSRKYEDADIILVGVSRSGKTPTSLYLAMQFGIFCANYPITEEDLEDGRLPKAVDNYRDKLFGLTIDVDRLASIRQERLANSRYASIQQCSMEIREAERLYQRFSVPWISTTNASIEEISTRILAETGLERRLR